MRLSLPQAFAAVIGLFVLCQGVASQGPNCTFYSVDMAFCGTQGLVTDQSSATVILACDQPFTGLCSENQARCLQIRGPEDGTVEGLSVPTGNLNSIQADVSWEGSYQGPVSVVLNCALSNGAGQSAVASPLQFSVQPELPIVSSAFQFL